MTADLQTYPVLDVPITIEGHVPDDRIDDCFRVGIDFVRSWGF